MPSPTDHDIAEVEQCDRDAAQSILWVETLIDDRAAIEQAFARHRLDTRPQPTDEMVDRLISLARRMARMPVKNEYPRGVIGREARDCFDTARAIVAAMGEGR